MLLILAVVGRGDRSGEVCLHSASEGGVFLTLRMSLHY